MHLYLISRPCIETPPSANPARRFRCSRSKGSSRPTISANRPALVQRQPSATFAIAASSAARTASSATSIASASTRMLRQNLSRRPAPAAPQQNAHDRVKLVEAGRKRAHRTDARHERQQSRFRDRSEKAACPIRRRGGRDADSPAKDVPIEKSATPLATRRRSRSTTVRSSSGAFEFRGRRKMAFAIQTICELVRKSFAQLLGARGQEPTTKRLVHRRDVHIPRNHAAIRGFPAGESIWSLRREAEPVEGA